MASEVDICNQALRLLGAERISALTDNSKSGKLCFDMYEQARDELLYDHRWNFATIRMDLGGADATGTAVTIDNITNRFQLPADFIRLWETDIDSQSFSGGLWRIEDGYLVTGESSVSIVYTRRVTQSGKFSIGFVRALAYLLASKFSVPLLRDTTLMSKFQEMADNAAFTAASTESMQNDVDDTAQSIFHTARLAGSSPPSNVTATATAI